jgi:excisionase family DNA binding protein
MQNDERLVMDLWPDAGRRLGLGKSATYQAAANGQIPVVRFGRLIKVPVRALEQMLDRAGARNGAA